LIPFNVVPALKASAWHLVALSGFSGRKRQALRHFFWLAHLENLARFLKASTTATTGPWTCRHSTLASHCYNPKPGGQAWQIVPGQLVFPTQVTGFCELLALISQDQVQCCRTAGCWMQRVVMGCIRMLVWMASQSKSIG